MAISDPGRGLVRRLGVTAAALLAFAAASQQRAEALSLASPGAAPSAKFATDGLTTEVQHRGHGGGGFRGGGGGGFRGVAAVAFAAAAVVSAAAGFMAVDSEAAVLRSMVAVSEAVALRSGGGFRAAPVFHGGGMRYGHRHIYHRPHFHHRHHFHRRFYAPRYYAYPYYHGYRHRYCRVIWTYYGPRKICQISPVAGVTAITDTGIGEIRLETKQASKWAPVLFSCKRNTAGSIPILASQGLIFHGVSFSIRHCAQCSGGQWLRREVSLGRRAAGRRCAASRAGAPAASPR